MKSKTLYFYLAGLILWALLFLVAHFLMLTVKERIELLLLTIVSAYLTDRSVRVGLPGRMDRNSWILFGVILLYAGFSCVGNDAFLYSIQVKHVIYYVLFTVWLVPIGIAFLYVTGWLGRKAERMAAERPATRGALSTWRLWAYFFLVPLSIGLLYLYAFFPGVMTNDSISQWAQASGKLPLDDWHPVFHTLLNKLLMGIYRSPASIAVGQIVFLSAVVAGFLVFLYRQGIPKSWLFVFVAVFSVSPQVGIYSVTLWKDIPFTISLLWLSLCLAKAVASPGFLRKAQGGLQLTAALVFVALLRHNGSLVYILVTAGLVIYLLKTGQRIGLIYISISVLLLAGYQFFILNRSDTVPMPNAIKLEAPIHGVAAVLANEASLPPAVAGRMDSIMPATVWRKYFYPYSAEDYQFNTGGVFIDRLSRMPTGEVLSMYASSFVRHPYLVVRDRLNGTDLIWNLVEPYNPYRLRYDTAIVPNELGLVQSGSSRLRTVIRSYLEFSEKKDRIFVWRVAVYTILLALGLLLVRIQKRGMWKVLLVCGPLIACILSLLPSMILQEYRYVYFIFFLFGFLWLYIVSRLGASRA